jgi:VanZ family protein
MKRLQAIGYYLKRWTPAIILMTVIFLLSSTPSSGLPNFGIWDLIIKKMGHMIGYAILALAFVRGLGGDSQKNTILAFSLAVLFAATDEIHQAFVPGRGAAWYDVVIDAVGAAAGLFAKSKFELIRKFITVEREPGLQTVGRMHDRRP